MDSLQQRWQTFSKNRQEEQQRQRDITEANKQLCRVFWAWAQQPANKPYMPLSTYRAEAEIRGRMVKGLNVSPQERLRVGQTTKQGRTTTARLPGSLSVTYHALYYRADGMLTDSEGKEVKFHLLDPKTTFELIADLCNKHSLTEPAFP